ncbi:hypothetical protein ACLQ2N_02470 [Streptomyces sp. DT224]|uniref:hypothetical protein n=1 Tax=unclassified Streptomyces TaxID=2593676 RepID=UPI0011CDEC24|nr:MULTISPECIES: hypothetical protein [unclassified Streptomyces]WRZ03582.1 hypothetical protein OG959_09605 [Streptomyces sp. NBC_00385]
MPASRARTSMACQELSSQLDALYEADCDGALPEQIGTRNKVQPEPEVALRLQQTRVVDRGDG